MGLRVLFITPHPVKSASIRYRIYQYVPYLESQAIECRVVPFTSSALYALIHEPGHFWEKSARASAGVIRRLASLIGSLSYDLVFINREAFPFGPPVLELLFGWLSGRMIFDFDDAIHLGHPGQAGLHDRILYKFKYARQTHWVVSAADLVIAGNRILADYALRYNPRVAIVPTVLDTERYGFRAPEPTSRPLVVGWMGSPSTSPHLNLLQTAFQELKRRYRERVQFAFFGAPDYKPPVEGAIVRAFSLEREIEDLRQLDIGVMPLADNEWTRGKCAFKAIQYMALGIPAVCSPVGMTPDLISVGENGFLCRTDAEWVDKLSALMDSLELRRAVAVKARQKIETEFSLRTWAPRMAEILKTTASGRFAKSAGKIDFAQGR